MPKPTPDQPTIRAETGNDYGAIHSVVRRAFGGRSQEALLVDAIRTTSGYVAELSLVAEEGEGIVGHVMFSAVALVKDDRSRSTILDLAPVSVHPDHQRTGVGSQLINAGLAAADARGDALVVVLGDLRYYGRFGFQPASHLGIEPPDSLPSAAFGVRRLSNYIPELRGTVEFPPVFAATGAL